jgi:hypothetical protein
MSGSSPSIRSPARACLQGIMLANSMDLDCRIQRHRCCSHASICCPARCTALVACSWTRDGNNSLQCDRGTLPLAESDLGVECWGPYQEQPWLAPFIDTHYAASGFPLATSHMPRAGMQPCRKWGSSKGRVDDNSSGVFGLGARSHTPDDLRCTVHRMLHVAAQLMVILVDLVARRFTGAFPLEPKKPFLSRSLAA